MADAHAAGIAVEQPAETVCSSPGERAETESCASPNERCATVKAVALVRRAGRSSVGATADATAGSEERSVSSTGSVGGVSADTSSCAVPAGSITRLPVAVTRLPVAVTRLPVAVTRPGCPNTGTSRVTSAKSASPPASVTASVSRATPTPVQKSCSVRVTPDVPFGNARLAGATVTTAGSDDTTETPTVRPATAVSSATSSVAAVWRRMTTAAGAAVSPALQRTVTRCS